MAFATTIVFYLIFLIFPFGQLLRINLFATEFPLIDIFIVLFSFFNIFTQIKSDNLKPKNKYLLMFIPIALTSLLLNLYFFHLPLLKSIFYFTRLTSFLLLIIFPPAYIPHKNLQKYLILSLFSCVIFGLIQYFFWPDLTYFNSQNWDPHLNRLVGSFLDPTFTALIYLLFLIFIFFNYPKSHIKNVLIALTYFALALTYSRSTYLALFIISFFVSSKLHRPKLFIFTTILLILTITFLPKPYGEGTKLDRTSSIYAKVQNYKQAINTIKQSPIIGLGYNTLFHFKDTPTNHSNSGFDNSFLTIFATTGIFGFIFFLKGFYYLYRQSSIFIQTTFLATTIHSFFANSFLYVWILFLLISFLIYFQSTKDHKL